MHYVDKRVLATALFWAGLIGAYSAWLWVQGELALDRGVCLALTTTVFPGLLLVANVSWTLQKQRANAYLDAAGDEAAVEGVDVLRRVVQDPLRRRGTKTMESAEARLRGPWSDLYAVVGPYPRGFPEEAKAIELHDPREVEPIWLWVSDPAARERLNDLALSRKLRAFLTGADPTTLGNRSIRDGLIRAEGRAEHTDAMDLAVLQSDVADVLRLFDQA